MTTPPVAKKVPKVDVVHGDIRQDDYYWLREKDDPEVLAYLRAENGYTDGVMKPQESFQESLYQEMLARIKEDDSSVPHRRGAYFFSRGSAAVSDDGHLVAYSTDITGFREYTLYVKDLRTGQLLSGTIERVASVAWAADNLTIFYVLEDEAKRPYRLYRCRAGLPGSELLYEETDALFRIGVDRSRSRAFLFLGAGSFTTSEWRYLPADQPEGAWQMFTPREKDHEYAVDHGGARFYIRTNGGGRRNFRLVWAPVADPRPERWTELIAHRDEVMLEDLDVFASHYIAHEREDGLIRLRVTTLPDGASHHIEFPEPTYEVGADANAEFITSAYRFRYQSLITPASVFDYNILTRERTLLKQTPVLGGYDPTQYRSERLFAV